MSKPMTPDDLRHVTLMQCVFSPLEVMRAIALLIRRTDSAEREIADYRTELELVREERNKLVMVTRMYSNVKYGRGN